MSFYDTPLADLQAAEQADPGWAMPHAMKAGFLLSLTEPSLVEQARSSLLPPLVCRDDRLNRLRPPSPSAAAARRVRGHR